MENYDKNTASSYLMYLDTSNLYGWAITQKLPVNGFEWVEELSQFNEDFIKDYDEESDEGHFLEVDVEYPKICIVFIMIYHFYSKGIELKNLISLFVTFMTRKIMLLT